MIVREHIEFERGGSAIKRLNIGILTWEKLKPGDILQNLRTVYIDKSRLSFHDHEDTTDNIRPGKYWIVKTIRENKTLLGEISLEIELVWTTIFRHATSMAYRIYQPGDLKYKNLPPSYTTEKSIDQWDLWFKIIHPKDYDLQESINFERGQDPKKALRIGKNRPFEPGEKVILLSSFDMKPYDTARYIRTQEDGGIVVTHPHQAEVVYSPEYVVRENVNFERGIEPKKSMNIGNKWVRLEPGDIIKCISRVVVTESDEEILFHPKTYEKAKYRKGFFYYYNIGDFGVIKHIIHKENKLKLIVIPFVDLKSAEEVSDDIREGKKKNLLFTQFGEATIEEWKKFFEVL